MHIATTRFGSVEVPEENLIHFKSGIIGFPRETRFALIPHGQSTLIAWLQSVQTPGLAFPVVSAHGLVLDYPDVALEPVAEKAGLGGSAEDFAAVAKDLVARGVTTAPQLGAEGASAGGLLMGIMLTEYPELFGALVCQQPLLDMRRYHQLLAGASWVAEFGDPDDPAEWAFIKKYSPYHNIDPGRRYPPVLITSSTRDDRVHPGHARKMTAALEAAGHQVRYYENIEGGHAGAANKAQAAATAALIFEFLHQTLNGA